MVCFDASVLIDLFDPRPTNVRKQRLDVLVPDLEQSKQKIILPAPAYSEFLIGAGRAREAYHKKIENMSNFFIEPFSKRAAVECAILLADVYSKKEQRGISKTKIKYDWMIVSIAKAINATCMYTSDGDIKRACERIGMQYVMIDSIALPTPNPQGDWIKGMPPRDSSGGVA